MRYTKYITILFALLAVSCNTDDLEQQLASGNSNVLQFVGRVMPFADCDVTTRAAKNEAKEYEVKTLDLLIFGNDGNCVYYAHSPNGEVVFGIDRGTKNNDTGEVDNGDFVGIDQANLTSCSIYAVANFPELKAAGLGIGNNKNDFLALSTAVSGIDVPSTGMPMLGGYSDEIDLSVNSTIKGSTPFEIPMKALYAKIVFNINVKATESISDKMPPQFVLESFQVHNVVSSVDFDSGTESSSGATTSTDDDVTGTDDATAVIKDGDAARVFQGAVTGSNIAIDGGSAVSFSFYLPERFVIPNVAADAYGYPFGSGTDIRPEDYNLRQRYKPLIAQDDATYVTFKGVYTNYQEHTYDVTYTIYLGNDNYSNFDIVRNRQYNNSIVIKGIQNSKDQSTNEQAVSIDHRVNVDRTLPIIVNLRRETLLDAHFEVRPLRIRANMNHELNNGGVVAANSAVKVTVEYEADDANKNWIGLERSYGDGQTVTNTYCSDSNKKSSHGKRRYFTTDLTTNTLAGSGTFSNGFSTAGGQTVVVPVTSNNECVWIYVDECTEASTNIDATRSAVIKVSYGTIENGEFVASTDEEHTLEYVINQHKLYTVTTTRKEYVEGTSSFEQEGIYYIEHEEEYLHNFDSDDTFSDNKTEDQGMVWGLDGIQLSYQYDAAYLDYTAQGILQNILSWLGWDYEKLVNEAFSSKNIKYDFYLIRDVENDETLKEHVQIRDFQGYEFNEQIVSYLLGTYADDEKAKLKEIALDEQPKSAIAYCYNRNKRNADGSVPEQVWYLPAIDEIEDIMEKEYSSFDGVFQKNKYWSCQPSYNPTTLDLAVYTRAFNNETYQNQMTGYYYSDNVNRARTTMVEYRDGAFKDVISSGSEVYGIQTGEVVVPTLGTPEFTFEDYKPYNLSYDNHPGNLPRNDVNNKARVRCIRRMVTE